MGIIYFAVNGSDGGGGSSAVNSENGISGDGSIATPIILGGSLNQNTTIENNGFVLGIGDFSSGTGLQFQIAGTELDCDYIEPNIDHGFVVNASGVQIFASDLNAVPNETANVNVNNNPGVNVSFFLQRTNETSAKFHELLSQTGIPGIQIHDDIDNVGLIGDTLFPISGPNQYAQYGNLQQQVAQIDQHNETATVVIPLYNLPVGNNQVLQINPFLFANTAGAGNINMNLTYTDVAGNAVSQVVGAISSQTAMLTQTVTINALAGSPVALSCVVSSVGYDFNVGASVVLLFNN